MTPMNIANTFFPCITLLLYLNTLFGSQISNCPNFLPSSYIGTQINQAITQGSTYTVPDDGFYLLVAYNSGSSNASAAYRINGVDVFVNANKFASSVFIPLKKGTVLETRSSSDPANNFGYVITSKFVKP